MENGHGRIEIMEASLRNLFLFGIWPKKNEELSHRRKYYTKFGFLAFMSLFLITFCSVHFFAITLKEANTIRVTDDLIWIMGQFGVIYFVIAFAVNQKGIAEIFLDLSDFSKYGKPPRFEEYNKRLNFQFKVFDYYLNLCMLGISGWNLLAVGECKKLNETRNLKDVCGTVAPTYLFFNFDYFPVKQIVFLWEAYCSIWSFKSASAISFLVMESMDHLICRIDHLKELIAEVVDEEDPNERQMKLAKWVQYHEDIFNFLILLLLFSVGKSMNRFYMGSLFLHVTISGVVFGIITYSFTVKVSFNAVGILTGWICSLAVVCIGGQRLMDASESVGVAVFHTNWYKRGPSFRKTLKMIIQRSQTRPLIINAGPIAQVNLVIMIGIFRTAYSYLNLMNASNRS